MGGDVTPEKKKVENDTVKVTNDTCGFTQRSHWHNGSIHGRHELCSGVGRNRLIPVVRIRSTSIMSDM